MPLAVTITNQRVILNQETGVFTTRKQISVTGMTANADYRECLGRPFLCERSLG